MTDFEADIRRAERAQAVLDDPLVAAALDALDRRVIERWRASAPDDAAARERLFLELRAAAAFAEQFRAHVTTGRMAAIARDLGRRTPA